MASLFVIQGRDQGARFELTPEPCSLGRDAQNTIQLHDTEVSRRHAEVRREGNGFVLTDLSSSNGTFVNGQSVQSQALASGDQVQLGRTVLLYTAPAGESHDLSDQIAIVSQGSREHSQIVRALKHEPVSEFFTAGINEASSPWLARARSNLQIMYRTALAVSHTLDIDQLLQRIMEMIFEWVEADRGCIMLIDPDTQALEPRVRLNRKGVKDEKISISRTILDYVTQRNEGVLTSDAREDMRWNAGASILQAGVREAICAPMQGRYHMVGVIYIDTSITPQRILRQGGEANQFTDEHLKLMIAIAHQAALAVEDTRYYSAMVQAERLAAVGQTIAVLSHHIKNILQGIRGGSYLIELGLNTHNEEALRKGWDIVDKNQNKISSLVMDMLSFSKEREPDLAPAALNTIVGDVVELMQTRAAEHQVRLEWRPDESLPELVLDAEGFHRAILNILTNAIDAAGNDEGTGVVSLSTEIDLKEKLARIVIMDNGPGIPPDELDKIFTIFVSSKGSRGTGLGLPVSQKIIREHGGQIRVTSKQGEGATFTIEFPAQFPAADSDSHLSQASTQF